MIDILNASNFEQSQNHMHMPSCDNEILRALTVILTRNYPNTQNQMYNIYDSIRVLTPMCHNVPNMQHFFGEFRCCLLGATGVINSYVWSPVDP